MEEAQLSYKQIADLVINMGKSGGAAFINAECMAGPPYPHLDSLLDVILDPNEKIDDPETIDWCKWLIAGGRTPTDFASIVRGYDNHAKCGLVWIPHVVAYRCRSCGISPCMSICRDCFKKGDHRNHDFNMFLSQAGGACDCGDTSVMKAEGFCCDHGVHNNARRTSVPGDLLEVAEAIMPRLLLRLLHHFRDKGERDRDRSKNDAIEACDNYCSMLMELNNMGELMRNVMTKTLLNPELYAMLLDPVQSATKPYSEFLEQSITKYEEAKRLFPSPKVPDEYKHFPALQQNIVHSTLLEELIFWTFEYEFPQNFVCFLLNMLPDPEYKEQLTRTFVMHYSRIPIVLKRSRDPDTLSNRVVHMSVQLFSNESLALKMVEELNLLHVMIISLKAMMSKNLIKNTLHDDMRHYVIDCATNVMKEHCYWPLVSDFNNVLSHESVALVFLRDDDLVDMWFQFLSMLQGMNVNVRETGSHIEYEPTSYYAAFSCELEASAYPMWSIISHLNDGTHSELAKKIMRYCINYLKRWLMEINFQQEFTKPRHERNEMMRASFHFPLHRYLAAFICQAVSKMNMSIKDIIPSDDEHLLPQLMIHPLRVQSFFYEILSGIWKRNGLQIKGQAMTYIQANFCNSMVDMDLFFLQICAIQLRPETYLLRAIESFGVSEWLGKCLLSQPQETEQDSMMEGLLTFLSTIVSSRTNLGNAEQAQCSIEISALLATGDRTHSQLLELMPERSGNSHARNFEDYLRKLSQFNKPPPLSENLEQGLYVPKPIVWEEHYDPLHVLLRAVQRRDFQNSMDRFHNYVKQAQKMPKSGNLWPPFRLPGPVGAAYSDPACILNSRILHAMILGILNRAVNYHNVSEHLTSLAIFLLEVAVEHTNRISKDSLESNRTVSLPSSAASNEDIPKLLCVYPGDCLNENLRQHVTRVELPSVEPQNSPANYNNTTFDSDVEWDVSEGEPYPTLMHQNSDASPTRLDVAIPQDLSIVREQSLVLHQDTMEENDTVAMVAIEPYEPMQLVPSVQAIAEYTPQHHSNPDANPIGQHLALPSNQLPSETGMEVVVRRNYGVVATGGPDDTGRPPNEMFSQTNPGTILPFQRVQPVAVPSRNMDIVAINANGQRRHNISSAFKSKPMDNSSISDPDFIVIEESILSLLLKLHSQLSGTLDSFSLDETSKDDGTGSDVHNTNADNDGDENMGVNYEAGPSNRSNASQTNFSRKILISESRIGDGPFFIGNLLRKIAKTDETNARTINEIRHRLWPNQREKQAEQKAKEALEKEERRRRARERQKQMMEKMANDQKKFMEQATEYMDCDDIETNEKEYMCSMCRKTEPSTETNPIGLIVLDESSGVLGHRRKFGESFKLPLADDEVKPIECARLATEFMKRTEYLTYLFGDESWSLTNNNSFDTGVYVQSCGHYVHLMCHEAYLRTLSSPRQPNLEQGEFLCPFCRQLSNSVLPLSSQTYPPSSIVRTTESPYEQLLNELTTLIRENERPPVNLNAIEFRRFVYSLLFSTAQASMQATTKLFEGMGRAFVDMTKSTHRNLQRPEPTFRRIFLFVTSVARTNLEAEIIQRGGSLCTNDTLRYRPKRECLVPLLNLLSVHLRVWNERPLWKSFAALWNHAANESNAAGPSQAEEIVPCLLADPIALMIMYTLIAPLRMEIMYFNCIVKVMFNLLYYQVVVQLCTTLTENECDEIIRKYSTEDETDTVVFSGFNNLGSVMAFILNQMDKCRHLRTGLLAHDDDDDDEDDDDDDNDDRMNATSSTATSAPTSSSASTSQLDLNKFEAQLQSLCLPFLRVAALLRHHLYEKDLPEIKVKRDEKDDDYMDPVEFVRLAYYLELVTDDYDWNSFNAAKALRFVPGKERLQPRFWCDQLIRLQLNKNQNNALTALISNQHIIWKQPKLLELPNEYEKLFTYYHEKACAQCQEIPKESSICLLCGTIVCLKGRCCFNRNDSSYEASKHSEICGGGTGIFLVVSTTCIIVIRGGRACLWGSLYLDDYAEEDRDLRRGKPLYLSRDRFNLLESQWLAHRFAHTKHVWVLHRNSL